LGTSELGRLSSLTSVAAPGLWISRILLLHMVPDESDTQPVASLCQLTPFHWQSVFRVIFAN
jgi:hypothetical protein